MDILKHAYTTIKDGFELNDFPDLEYFRNLDNSEGSRKLIENAAKEVSKKLLAKAATMASQKLLDELMPRLENMRLPDHTGHAPLVISQVEYTTSEATISRVHRPESVVTIENNVINWNLTNIGVSGVGNWKYSFLEQFKDNGGFDLDIGGIGVSVAVQLQKDDRGKIDMKLVKCDCVLGNPDLNFTGGGVACFCINLIFENKVKPELHRIIPRLLEVAVKQVTEGTVPHLRSIEDYWPLAMGVIDVSSNLIRSALH